MSLRDRDLISIQEARELVARAAAAQKKFSAFSQEQVDAVVEACAKAAADNAEALARIAVEETGYGNVPDKIIKNTLAAVEVTRAIRAMRTVGVLREDREKGIVEVASPDTFFEHPEEGHRGLSVFRSREFAAKPSRR